MKWQLYFVCALWGLVMVSGRNLRLPDIPESLPTTTLEPIVTTDSTTLELNSTAEPIASPEPIPILRSIPHRVPRAVAFDDLVDPGQPSVEIAQGTVVGSVADDGDYFQFYGIPYADSTSGAHRFKAPSPPPTFQSTFVADRKNIKCVRALGAGYEGTEDCLVANVFTPSLDTTSQLPVMVWIKGREFDKVYEHELSFRNFVDKEVIVVSLNYRESVLGFLCLGTPTAPGNAGLKDIIAGLRWVKENVAQFGGNPNDITLFGHGSGAAAVDLVTLSPLADGLVNKAISQSGNAMAPWAVSRDNLKYAIEVAEALGHVITNIEELSQIFERTSVAALMGVINELELTENALAFAPCIEKQNLEGVQPFLTRTPTEIISDGDFLQIPFITGFVGNEGTIRAEEALEDGWLERMENTFADFLQPDLKFENDEERALVAQQIRQYYFQDDTIDLSTVDDYLTYQGETMMSVSSIREVRTRAQVSTAPTYLYMFSYKGELGAPFVGPIEVETAAHSEELAYLFYRATGPVSIWDLTVADIIIERWTNFAKTGIPSTEISQITWRPFTPNDQAYLHMLSLSNNIDASLEIDLINPLSERISFWDAIYEEHFLDAESNWELISRDEDDDLIEDSGEEDGTGEDNGGNGTDNAGSGEDNGSTEEDNESSGEENEDSGNSASTAIGYTFVIVALFSVLDKFHVSQIIS